MDFVDFEDAFNRVAEDRSLRGIAPEMFKLVREVERLEKLASQEPSPGHKAAGQASRFDNAAGAAHEKFRKSLGIGQ